ncbi:hypothetical protein TI05_04490 [Achromatium sp. WMS3]|nr:hypothetical protein TI05_04490 [Achromatium sp. WMS3]
MILGATPKIERYANMAQREFMARGYQVIPVHPKIQEIEGLKVTNRLCDIDKTIHTLTLYVGAARSELLIEDILKLQPLRVIFNPGSESSILESQLQQQNIETIQGCTLVMLRTMQF